VAVGVLLALSKSLARLATDAWWFEAVGFADAFWVRVGWQWGLGLVGAIAFALAIWLNYGLAMRLTRDRPLSAVERMLPGWGMQVGWLRAIVGLFSGLIGLVAGVRLSSHWEVLLLFWHTVPFGVRDPIFQQDVAFYVFQLPVYEGLQQALLIWLGLGTVTAIALYALKEALPWVPGRGQRGLDAPVRLHLSIAFAAIALVVAIGFLLARFELLYSPDGVVFGAGYTDVRARLQGYWFMGFVTLAVAALFLSSLWRRNWQWPILGLTVAGVLLVVVTGVYPGLQQALVVAPNELAKETPYVEHNLNFTRQAYGLDQITRADFPVDDTLDRAALDRNAATLENLRLWDYRPLLSTYRQLQEIRLYYRFNDVDVDRYTLQEPAGDRVQQVMLSARELDYGQVPAEAQTWVNQHLTYTHGYGLVMSPVNRVTPDGLPDFYIKDIPPASRISLDVTQPRIYYGESTNTYVFTGTTTPEFDYPQGDTNAVFHYDGNGGVPLSSLLRRWVYAFDRSSLPIAISNYFTPDSRIHYRRNIYARAAAAVPFLRLDGDPYLVLVDGRLQWILDAYTVSDRYPYSEPIVRSPNVGRNLPGSAAAIARGNTNYVRNSVKVVIDAYDGTVRCFGVDEADPILAAYRQAFPTLFEPRSAMPAALRDRLRYPADLFTIQAQMYLAYHMDDPQVFYNREDLWRFPMQVYESEEEVMQPYYVTMRLPEVATTRASGNSQNEEFALILPLTPANKDNAIAWMAARSDGDRYGELLLYDFPNQQLIYGPSQIEARIDQDPTISQQLTLWSQEGSKVIRGDLLVLPIESSILYVEPVYLRAERGELPELKRVIVSYANRLAMEPTLDAALAAVFGEAGLGEPGLSPVPDAPTGATPGGDRNALARSALDTYRRAQAALQSGDWATYGRLQTELGQLLEQLGNAPTTPIAPDRPVANPVE
jgi:uncharacterized membrane protein (UPF0182 family)